MSTILYSTPSLPHPQDIVLSTPYSHFLPQYRPMADVVAQNGPYQKKRTPEGVLFFVLFAGSEAAAAHAGLRLGADGCLVALLIDHR